MPASHDMILLVPCSLLRNMWKQCALRRSKANFDSLYSMQTGSAEMPNYSSGQRLRIILSPRETDMPVKATSQWVGPGAKVGRATNVTLAFVQQAMFQADRSHRFHYSSPHTALHLSSREARESITVQGYIAARQKLSRRVWPGESPKWQTQSLKEDIWLLGLQFPPWLQCYTQKSLLESSGFPSLNLPLSFSDMCLTSAS